MRPSCHHYQNISLLGEHCNMSKIHGSLDDDNQLNNVFREKIYHMGKKSIHGAGILVSDQNTDTKV